MTESAVFVIGLSTFSDKQRKDAISLIWCVGEIQIYMHLQSKTMM